MIHPLRIRYQTIEFDNIDIHLCTLRDRQQFSDPNDEAYDLGISSASWSLFGVIWPSSIVLANYMLDYKTEGKKILEVGCGVGLSSLLLKKQQVNITATDLHPEANRFLNRNTKLNNTKAIPFQRVDWADDNNLLGQFDLIIGSDLLYEDQHVLQLARFIQNHATSKSKVIIVDPGRGRKNKFNRAMSEYGFKGAHIKPINTDYLEKQFKGDILQFSRNI